MQVGLWESGTSDVKAEVTGEVLAKDIAFTVESPRNGRVPDVNLSWAPDGPPVAILNGNVRVTIQLENGRTLAGFIVSTVAYPDLSSGRTRFEVVIDWDPIG